MNSVIGRTESPKDMSNHNKWWNNRSATMKMSGIYIPTVIKQQKVIL